MLSIDLEHRLSIIGLSEHWGKQDTIDLRTLPVGHGPNPEKGLFFVFVATFWRQSEYT